MSDKTIIGNIMTLVKAFMPKKADLQDAVDTWLDDHPEATTTVEDGAITYAKLHSDLKEVIDEVPQIETQVENVEKKFIKRVQVDQITYANKAWNAYGVNVGDTFDPEYMNDETGSYCAKISVEEGQKYKIVANGTAYSRRSYVITNSSHIVTRVTTTAFDGDITIEEGESTLYVTMPSYNSATDGVWRVIETEILDDLQQEINEFSSINLSSKGNVTDFLYTDQGYNLGGSKVGDKYTSGRTSNDKNSCQVITVEENTKYYVYGVGNNNSFCLYAILDKDDYIIEVYKEITNHRTVPKEIVPPEGSAYIIVNYWNYDAETDHTEKLTMENVNGLIKSVYNPLEGKTILLLGDSILGNDRYCGVADYLGQYTGANIINGAIGGTRICGTTRGVSDYTPFDGENLVTAITTGVWTDQDASAGNVTSYVASQTLPALKAMDLNDVDIVIFNWMANDYTSSTTAEQYKIAYKNVVDMLLTANPKLRLLSVTMEWFWTADGGTDVTSLYAIGTGYDASDCTIEASRLNHVPVIDMYRDSPVCDLTKSVYLDSDKVHLNTVGNMAYAKLLTEKLNTIMI